MLVRIPTNMMSATALAEHVASHMGLEVSHTLGVDKIKERMKQAGYEADFVEIDDGIEPEIVRKEPTFQRNTPGKRMCHIRIEEQEKAGGAEPVFVSVNGVHMLIERAKNSWVDYKYYHVLKNANQSIPIVDEDNKIIGWRTVPEYPMSVFHIEPPLSKDEIEENNARLKAEAEAREAAAAAEEMVS